MEAYYCINELEMELGMENITGFQWARYLEQKDKKRHEARKRTKIFAETQIDMYSPLSQPSPCKGEGAAIKTAVSSAAQPAGISCGSRSGCVSVRLHYLPQT